MNLRLGADIQYKNCGGYWHSGGASNRNGNRHGDGLVTLYLGRALSLSLQNHNGRKGPAGRD